MTLSACHNSWSRTQTCCQGAASGCKARATIFDAPTRNLQNIKHNHTDQPAKETCGTLLHPPVVTAEPPWLDTTHFQKRKYVQNILYSVRLYCVVKVLILWSWQRRFSHLCILRVLYTLYYNKAIRHIETYVHIKHSASTVFMIWLRAWSNGRLIVN
jgi:hypothetical protein